MKDKIETWRAFLIPFGAAVLAAAVADRLLYALGIGTMHAIGSYQGRGWMGNMTFPAWPFFAGLAGFLVASAGMIINKTIRAAQVLVAFTLYQRSRNSRDMGCL